MNYLKLMSLALMYAGFVFPLQAAPHLISTIGNALGTTTTTYSLFAVNTTKTLKLGLTVPQVKALLQTELDASLTLPKITACWVTGDLNISAINCGNGAMQIRNTDMYTYNIPSNIPVFPLSKAINPMILKAQGANFLAPTTTATGQIIAGDSTGRVVNIHFNKRMAQFGLLIDSGQAGSPSTNGIQFVVNRQATPVQKLVGGVPVFVGVEDGAGFTDVTLITSGEVGFTSETRSWIADHFSFVLLSAF